MLHANMPWHLILWVASSDPKPTHTANYPHIHSSSTVLSLNHWSIARSCDCNAHTVPTLHGRCVVRRPAIKTALDALGVEYIVTGGSLLGAVRQHSILFCDDDIDVTIIDPDGTVYPKVCGPTLHPTHQHNVHSCTSEGGCEEC
jgi:hypothetical protein